MGPHDCDPFETEKIVIRFSKHWFANLFRGQLKCSFDKVRLTTSASMA